MLRDEDKVISSLWTMIAISRCYLVPFKIITFHFFFSSQKWIPANLKYVLIGKDNYLWVLLG